MPISAPVWVSDSPPAAWAMPKSTSMTRPSGVTRMLAGLRSRWTIPASWATCRAAAISATIAIVSPVGSEPRSASSADSGAPSMSGMTRNGTGLPSSSSSP